MTLIETEETNQYTFEAFAAHGFYTEINRSLVRRALASIATRPNRSTLTIVDMACGTGAISRLVAEEIRHHGRQAHIIGVDPSAEALRRAQRGMEEAGLEGSGVHTDFIQGEADDLPKIVQHADAAFFCNAIHLLPDKLSAFRLTASILAPGGIFACNSGFYEGTYVEGTERFYRLWTRRAVGWLRKEHPEIRLSRESKATAMQWLTPEEYIDLLKQSGFDSVDARQECAIMTVDSYHDIGQYWLFIEGALPGVPLPVGAAALGISVYQAGQELGIKEIPRNWLQIVARKL
ncbi:MAG TPA: methyltransferase domain-containing protein [Ktedonobacteraceae bacterium]|nr:methyltransferase domain-containing protein [Ktedonobacteraceae bacterium]